MKLPGNIPFSVRPLFWLVALLIGWLWTGSFAGTLIAVGIIFFSVLVHELGHAWTALFFKQQVRIELAAFGGFTYREGGRLKLWQEFLVVLAGPLAGFLLCLAAYACYHYLGIQNAPLLFSLQFTFVANLFWTVMNLVPVLPLDGGHLLSIVLEAIFGFKGVKIAIIVGLVIAIGVGVLFLVLGMFLVASLFMFLIFDNIRSLKYYKIFNEKDRQPEFQNLLKEAEDDLMEDQIDAAMEKLEAIRKGTQEGVVYTVATGRLAELLHQQGRDEQAYQILLSIQNQVTQDQIQLFHALAFKHENYQLVADLSSTCFQENPSCQTALLNALAYGALGQPEPSIGWLECAVREGLPSIKEVITRKELDPIREHPQFVKWLRSN